MVHWQASERGGSETEDSGGDCGRRKGKELTRGAAVSVAERGESASGLRGELAGRAEEAGPRRWCWPCAEEGAGRSREEFWGRVWFSFFWFFFLLFFFKLHSTI